MGHNSFLERHGQGWRFRVRLPRKLSRLTARRELRVRLGTIPHANALAHARALRVEAQRLFEAVWRMTTIEEAEAAIEAWRAECAAQYAIKLVDEGRLYLAHDEMRHDPPGVTEDAGLGIDLLMRCAHELTLDQRLGEVRRALAGDQQAREKLAPVIASALRAARLDANAPQRMKALLTVKALQAHASLLQDLVGIANGDPDILEQVLRDAEALRNPPASVADAADRADREGTIQPPLASARRSSASGAAAQAAMVKGSSQPADPSPSARPFEEVWAEFIEAKIGTLGEWKPSRKPELLASGRIWRWLVDREVGQATRADLVAARETYLWLPKNYDRDPDYATRTPREIVEAAKAAWHVDHPDSKGTPTYQRTSAKTFNKHLSNWRAFFTWLAGKEDIAKEATSIFENLGVKVRKKGKAGSAEREAYTLDEIRRIFESPIWTGHKTRRVRTEPGQIIVADALYWVPLMAAFHGMRREEACQLRSRDIVEQYGIWYFDLNAPDLSVKRDEGDEDTGSRRKVPLHAALLELGFVERFATGRDKDLLLFPELSNENLHAAYGAALGSAFKYYQMRVFPDMRKGLHRLRHRFVTELENTDVKSAFIDALTGHTSAERPSERRRYTKEIYLHNLKETIDRLRLPIDIPKLKDALARYEVKKSR